MAERRMFAKTIIDSDAFLDMPSSAQALYFHLAMRADDDGFVNSPKKVQRMVGASDDDARLLLMKRFLIAFDSGVVVIKHWRIHNYLRSDRYKPTNYKDEMAMLTVKDNGAYTVQTELPPTSGIPVGIPSGRQMVDHWETQDSIGKDSIGKVSIGEDRKGDYKGKTKFSAPDLEEVKVFCYENGLECDPEEFFDYYTANGWKVGKSSMKDWKAALRNWDRRDKDFGRKPKPKTETTRKDDSDRLMRMLK